MMTLDALEANRHAPPRPELMAWSRWLAACKEIRTDAADSTGAEDGEDGGIDQYRAWALALAAHQRLRARLALRMAGADALTLATLRTMAKGCLDEPC